MPQRTRPVAIESLESRSLLSATNFTVVGLPDTQVYAWKYPQIFTDQTKWVVANLAAQDVRFVTHFGDVVQHGYDGNAAREWANARKSMKVLEDANVPTGVAAGNHDVLKTGGAGQPVDPKNFLANFGPKRYAGKSWYLGASPSGLSSAQTFGTSGRKFLAISLYVETPSAELAWAQGVIDANSGLPVMITTHKYLKKGADRNGDGTGEQRFNPAGITAPDLVRHFVEANRNIFLVNAGHYSNEYRTVGKNRAGLPVHELTADFQSDDLGGAGYLRLMHFDLANNRIDVETYSPHLDKYDTDSQCKFSIKVDFAKYVAQNKTVRLQNGVGKYAGTQDTWIGEDHKATAHGGSEVLKVDDDLSGSSTSDDRGQSIIKFDGLIGTGAGQVPKGAKIVRAELKLTLNNDIIDAAKNADFDLRLMTRSWSESSTWNSLSGGLTSADYGVLVATFKGANSPAANFVRRVDVRAAVQSWADGQKNHGLAILPQIVKKNDDGIRLFSSEAASVIFRPVLEVEYVMTK